MAVPASGSCRGTGKKRRGTLGTVACPHPQQVQGQQGLASSPKLHYLSSAHRQLWASGSAAGPLSHWVLAATLASAETSRASSSLNVCDKSFHNHFLLKEQEKGMGQLDSMAGIPQTDPRHTDCGLLLKCPSFSPREAGKKQGD